MGVSRGQLDSETETEHTPEVFPRTLSLETAALPNSPVGSARFCETLVSRANPSGMLAFRLTRTRMFSVERLAVGGVLRYASVLVF